MMLGRATLVGLVSGLLSGSAAAQVLSVAELNVDQIRGLDRLGLRRSQSRGASHDRALDEAADYFQQTYGGRMVHLLGSMDVVTCCEGWRGLVSPDAVAENGLSVPAGLVAQSGLLFLRPDLVPPAFLKILDRRPGPTSPRYSDEIVKNPVVAAVVADSLAGDRALEARQEAWLKKQSPWPAGPRW